MPDWSGSTEPGGSVRFSLFFLLIEAVAAAVASVLTVCAFVSVLFFFTGERGGRFVCKSGVLDASECKRWPACARRKVFGGRVGRVGKNSGGSDDNNDDGQPVRFALLSTTSVELHKFAIMS